MTVTSASPQATSFDLRATSTHAIHLGRTLQQKPQSAQFTGVAYNHKPVIADPEDTTTSIVPSQHRNRTQLSLKDGDDEYTYESTEASAEHTYVLIPSESGEGYVLERLGASYKFNLSSAPWEQDATALAQKYPQLQAEEGDDAELEDNLVEITGADAGNPFDFRHYIQTTDSPSPVLRPKGSTVGTPAASQPPSRTSTPLGRPAKKPPSAFAAQMAKSKAKAKAKPKASESTPQQSQPSQHKRVRLSPERETEGEHTRREDVPSVRLDRRASTRIALPPQNNAHKRAAAATAQPPAQRHNTEDLSLDDDGDLILEGDAPATTSSYRHQPHRSLGLALSGALGDGHGPRSLRSAASSPASRIESPGSRRPSPLGDVGGHVDTDGEDIDIDMGSPDDGGQGYRARRLHDSDADGESDVDVDADADIEVDDDDVEEMQLPSPAAQQQQQQQQHRPSMAGTVASGTADDDFDLEQQMLLELEGEDDEGDGPQQRVESDEESEEE
ncbi:hypothetical protein MBLNU459_g5891t1 [Dothideomycetes sp. NU459]